MKVVVVFLLAVLGCSLTAGRIVSKCELRDELMKAIGNMKDLPKGEEVDDLVAKLVCHAEKSSGLNTSAVQETIGMQAHKDHLYQNQHRFRGRRHAEENSSDTQHAPPAPPTLYGVFQLSNHMACSDGETPSANICGTDCSELLDDDICDDIKCLLKFPSRLGHNQEGNPGGMNGPVFDEECDDVEASVYFAEC